MNDKNKKEYIKTKYSANDLSNYNPDYTLGQVIEDKLKYLLGKTLEYPYISVVTKNKLFWSDKPFNELDKNDYRRIPLVGGFDTNAKHVFGRKPTISEQRRQQSMYGYCMSWPHESLLTLVQNKFNALTKKLIKDNSNLLPIPFRTYVDKNGQAKDPAWNSNEPFAPNYYSGYLFLCDNYTDSISRYLSDADTPKWIKAQYLIAKDSAINRYHKKNIELLKQLELNQDMVDRTVKVTNQIKMEVTDEMKNMLLGLTE